MKAKHRKQTLPTGGPTVKPVDAALRGANPQNRIAHYFGEWPAVGADNQRADRAEQLQLRRERAQRIAALPLDYVPSEEFHLADAERRAAGPAPAGPASARKTRPPAGLPPYLASLYEAPLLTAEQERHLFRKYNFLKFRAAALRNKLNLARPQVRLMNEIERLYRDAVATKNHIIQANLRLVVSIMKRYVTESDGTFELISDGNVSLIRAVERFDYSRGAKFSTYATWAIQKNNARRYADDVKYRSRFQTSHEEALEASPQEHFDPQQAERAQRERSERVARILERLDGRDRQIIEGRFGLSGNLEAKTLKEVGEQMGVSKERVRQLEARAMSRLRELAQDARLGDTLD